MAKTKYDATTKAAVLAALLAGQGLEAVAEEYKVPVGTVKAWRHRMRGAASETKAATENAEEIGDLLVRYLRTNLETLQQQQVFFRDVEWLKKQNAADLAVLHGVTTDKAIRLLEALGNNGSVAPQPTG